MTINKYLTKYNYNIIDNKINKYIVIHYTANNGDTALGNCKYSAGADRGAGANYFVDENSIYQSIEDNNVAWHCGASKYKHLYCRNSNSLGIEMCSRKDSNNNYYIKNETINNAVELCKMLMGKYGIGIDNVLRHYDVTGKNCPEPFVRDIRLWADFKNRLTESATSEKEADEVVTEGKLIVNGKEYKVDRILKDDTNFVKLANFDNMGFKVGYNADTKTATLDNEPHIIKVNDNNIEAFNVKGYNCVRIRDLANVLGKDVTVEDSNIIVK